MNSPYISFIQMMIWAIQHYSAQILYIDEQTAYHMVDTSVNKYQLGLY